MTDVLDRTPKAAVRLLALKHLRDARRASKRLASGDPDAIHDFRVGLRRLRTLAKVFRAYFGQSIRGRDRRRIRQLRRRLNGLRDLHAYRALLVSLPGGSSWTNAAAEVAARLELRIEENEAVLAGVRKKFRKLDRRLRRRLTRYEESIDLRDLSNQATYRSAAVSGAATLADQLASALVAVQSSADEKPMHEARLAAKRLRYTLQPLDDSNEAVRDATRALTTLQDLLGQLRDGARLREIVREERLKSDASLAQEFAALAKTMLEHAARNYDDLQEQWLGDHGAGFFQDLSSALEAISPKEAVRSTPRPAPELAESPLPAPSSA